MLLCPCWSKLLLSGGRCTLIVFFLFCLQNKILIKAILLPVEVTGLATGAKLKL